MTFSVAPTAVKICVFFGEKQEVQKKKNSSDALEKIECSHAYFLFFFFGKMVQICWRKEKTSHWQILCDCRNFLNALLTCHFIELFLLGHFLTHSPRTNFEKCTQMTKFPATEPQNSFDDLGIEEFKWRESVSFCKILRSENHSVWHLKVTHWNIYRRWWQRWILLQSYMNVTRDTINWK